MSVCDVPGEQPDVILFWSVLMNVKDVMVIPCTDTNIECWSPAMCDSVVSVYSVIVPPFVLQEWDRSKSKAKQKQSESEKRKNAKQAQRVK
jgi:hypothetical protein